MKRSQIAACFAAGFTSACLLGSAVAEPAPLDVVAHGSITASDTVERCVQTTGRLDVLFLLDESASMATSDPEAQRVAAVRAALVGLEEAFLAPSGDGDGGGETVPPEIYVLFAGFAVDYEAANDSNWLRLDAESLPELSALAGSFATRNRGRDSDYVTALLRARAELLSRAVWEDGTPRSPAPCQVLVFLTDGAYSFMPRNGNRADLPGSVDYAPGADLTTVNGTVEATATGRERLCGAHSLADELRSDGVVTLVVGLDPETTWEPLLRAIAGDTEASRNASVSCGHLGSSATGRYLPAPEADDLVFDFGGLGDNPRPTVCEVAETQCKIRFELVDGLRGFDLLVTTSFREVSMRVAAPGGDTIEIEQGSRSSTTVGGVDVETMWLSDRSVEIVGRRGSEAPGDGRWEVSFEAAPGSDVAQLKHRLRLLPDMRPVLREHDDIVIGDEQTLAFDIVGSDGGAYAGPLRDGAAVVVGLTTTRTAEPQQLSVQGPDEEGTFRAKLGIPSSSSSGEIEVTASLHFAQPTDGSIPEVNRTFKLTTRQPLPFPVVTPSRLDLGTIHTRGSVTGKLTIKGGESGLGCVWVEDASFTGPDGPLGVAIHGDLPYSSGECVEIPAHSSQEFRVEFKRDEVTEGRALGDLIVGLRTDAIGGDRSARVAVSFRMDDRTVSGSIWIFVVLMLLGAFVPLLVIWLLNWSSARFAAPQDFRAIVLSARVQGNIVLDCRKEPPQPLALTFEEHAAPLVGAGMEEFSVPCRQFPLSARPQVEDGLTLQFKARATQPMRRGLAGVVRQFWVGPTGEVSAEGAALTAGTGEGNVRAWDEHTACEVPLSVAGTWVFVRSADAAVSETRDAQGSAGGATDGVLFVLMSDRGSRDQYEVVSSQIRQHLPKAVAEMPPQVAVDGNGRDDPPPLPVLPPPHHDPTEGDW